MQVVHSEEDLWAQKESLIYPDPLIKVNDAIQVDWELARLLTSSRLTLITHMCLTRGADVGSRGGIATREKHPGAFDVVHGKDAKGNSFAT